MTSLVLPRLISCDESGFSGNDMLGSGQPYFSYASHDLHLEDAEELIRAARARFPVQMPELKAWKLMRSPRGRDLLTFVLDALEGHYIATIYDKKFSLACKLFEYLYEPVLQRNNRLFYDKNLHLFVANYLYMQMQAAGASAEQVAAEFERFMRTLDPVDAPTLFGGALRENPDPLLGQIIRFTRGYNVVIASETRALQRSGAGKWVLDLSISAVASHLRDWSDRHKLLDVVCDESKPIKDLSNAFDGMINRPDDAFIEMRGKRRRIVWNMVGPVRFASSATHAGIQVADLVAGVAGIVPIATSRDELRPLAERVVRHLNEECIWPDVERIDLNGEEAPVNWVILEGLASRADEGLDPLAGMELMYDAARASLPEFRQRIVGRADVQHQGADR
ncbi:DUF3800 domain-containing protein [Methylorubrum populi]|jgi:Protein of unknown function (DUF3800)|uniref:DUF3800 domain-containing protein n=1 Tax=Methylorubrum rhodesianum TaxID=29427 RepID=A0ABU9Z6Z8_9HYPH|nr:DUF3800 domain-containing protein [Methylorubrum rhodesianum]MBK3403452.1 DUF3800 domain-containing protein [Methylorubrum rhodesianum]MBY0140322.1 DUF3800 domain-containing protein [Methylorubrum populi]